MDKNDSKSDNDRSDVCRDFLRDDCRRGANCKYFHPSDVKPEIQFCFDFQNGNCSRSKCKFIHCAPEEEANYLQGKPAAPRPSGRTPMRQNKRVPPNNGFNGNSQVCRDFVAGTCTRGSSCKFSHNIPSRGMMGGGNDFNNSFGFNGPCNDMLNFTGADGFFNPLNMGGGGLKRNRPDFEDPMGMMPANFAFNIEMEKLQQENGMLRQKLDQCQKQILELTSANDMILEQNARLRMQSVNGPQMPYMSNNNIPNSIPKPSQAPAQLNRQMVPGYY